MWILLNPGPANTSASVKQALVMDDLCHREPECFEMMRRCRDRLVALAGAGPDFTAVLFAGSGTAAVEAMIASAVPPASAATAERRAMTNDTPAMPCRHLLALAATKSMPSCATSRRSPKSELMASTMTRRPCA